jgi:uncharacterized protein YgbK (DUF1537 family)
LLRIFILADDLSGAADCGVACAGAGLETLVALRQTGEEPAAEVLSLDADTRRMGPEEAAQEVERLIRAHCARPDLLLFKKIDSTLRGNVGAELAAALNALNSVRNQRARTLAIMAPAFPAIGRTTIDGSQLAHGQPLHELDIWRVQGLTGRAHIPDMLRAYGLRCEVLGLDAVRAPLSDLVEKMNAAACESDVLVCDAETDSDLLAVATASMQMTAKPLWVGSAGLAYQLPRAAGIAKKVKGGRITLPPVEGPVLFAIGSLSRNSLEQVRVLASFSGTVAIKVPPAVLLGGEQHADWRAMALELERTIRDGRDVVLSPEAEPRIELDKRPLIAAGLARLVASVAGNVGALVASGGETARAVFESIGVARLRLLGELEKGIPISITENWNRPLPVITKAGDFGVSDALLKCSRFLQGSMTGDASAGTIQAVANQTGKVVE